mmetsp:Transcript_14831/g.26945  ORF Transcript_14831/g.26945 Transcript_14831/m.26945 type:complete len:253 (-) Transcript_14831:378-1136(-)
MGRSQVARNRAARGGRGGRGRGGRDGGDSSTSGGGRSSSSSRHKGGGDPRKLGTNDFRHERSTSDNTSNGGGDAFYDGLLDDSNFMSTGRGGLGEFYGDSHYAAGKEEEDLADATLLAQQSEVEDWMSIDVKALDKCLKQIPIHERLKLPYHIGKHLESMYGADGGGGGRKKTLAELREESKSTHVEDDSRRAVSNDPKSEKEGVQTEKMKTEQSDSTKMQPDNMNNNDDESDVVADDDGDDLEAWLDDMIG